MALNVALNVGVQVEESKNERREVSGKYYRERERR
jgi:hypothetical protein